MDAIGELISTLRVESVLYGSLEARAPWGIAFPASEALGFGAVTRGHCWLLVEGRGEAVGLASGDCFLLAGGSGYVLCDHAASRRLAIAAVAGGDCRTGQKLEVGGSGAPAAMILGRFTFDHPRGGSLNGLLPPLIHIAAERARQLWLHATLELLAAEAAAGEPGAPVVMSRLADILFVQMLRAHAGSVSDESTGWLRGIADPELAPALNAMHARLDQSWTVESLAAAAHMSRSGFAARFKTVMGEAPLEYLTRWRMYKASRWLRDGNDKLSAIAQRVGYDSGGAFHRAFKRVLGVAPGRYRRGAANAAEEANAS